MQPGLGHELGTDGVAAGDLLASFEDEFGPVAEGAAWGVDADGDVEGAEVLFSKVCSEVGEVVVFLEVVVDFPCGSWVVFVDFHGMARTDCV